MDKEELKVKELTKEELEQIAGGRACTFYEEYCENCGHVFARYSDSHIRKRATCDFCGGVHCIGVRPVEG